MSEDIDLSGFGVEDFNTETDYKPQPVIPTATYKGCAKADFNPGGDSSPPTIVFNCRFQGNPNRMCSDQETPVDGQELNYTLWFPVPGDEHELSSNGKDSKKDVKIRMLTEALERLQISAKTPKEMISQIQNGDWVFPKVLIKVKLDTYEGRKIPKISNLTLDKSTEEY